jgi:hypothetical protein
LGQKDFARPICPWRALIKHPKNDTGGQAASASRAFLVERGYGDEAPVLTTG